MANIADDQRRSPVIRILVVDDHDLFARILIRFLSNEPDLEVVGKAASGHEALAMVDELAPDVMVLDFGLPDLDGPTVCKQVKATRPEMNVIMLSGYPEQVVMPAAVESGCSGFMTKTKAVDELVDMIRALHSGAGALSAPSRPT